MYARDLSGHWPLWLFGLRVTRTSFFFRHDSVEDVALRYFGICGVDPTWTSVSIVRVYWAFCEGYGVPFGVFSPFFMRIHDPADSPILGLSLGFGLADSEAYKGYTEV